MYEAPEKFPSDLPSDEELPRATCLEASQGSLEQLTQNARGPRPQPVWDHPLKQQVHSVAVGREAVPHIHTHAPPGAPAAEFYVRRLAFALKFRL